MSLPTTGYILTWNGSKGVYAVPSVPSGTITGGPLTAGVIPVATGLQTIGDGYLRQVAAGVINTYKYISSDGFSQLWLTNGFVQLGYINSPLRADIEFSATNMDLTFIGAVGSGAYSIEDGFSTVTHDTLIKFVAPTYYFSSFTASTVVYSDASKNLVSLANSTGVLTNDGSGGLSWVAGGAGSVTSVSVVTANGVSGSVATATTTPAITLALGAITPSSVNGNTITTGTGTLTFLGTDTLTITGPGSVSGTNTGDQTNISGNSATTTAAAITDDTTTNAVMYPVWVTTNTGNLPLKITSTKLSYNPSTGLLTSTLFNKVTITTPSTGSTLTLADNSSWITSGAFATTITITATTGVTLPTSGTLYGTKTGSITSAQLLNSLTDPTGTGVAVFGTAPTFTTSITTPLIYGGTAVGSGISYTSTTGAGTTTGAAHTFAGGTNGATNIATLYNDGQFLIGTTTRNPGALGVLRLGQGTSTIDIGEMSSGLPALWLNVATPSTTNYAFSSTGTTATSVNVPTASGGTFAIKFANSAKYTFGNTTCTFTPASASSAAPQPFTFTAPASTNQTLSTEINGFSYALTTNRQWATGALTTQREFLISAPTYRFVGSSTITDAVTFEVTGDPVASTNATITRAWTARLLGKVAIGTSMYIGSATGVVTPTSLLHLAAGTATASTAPLKLTSSGTGLTGLLGTPEAGAIEFTTYGLWITNTAGARQKNWEGLIGQTSPATAGIGTITDYYGASATRVLTTPNTWISIIGDDGNPYRIPAYNPG